MPSHNTVTPPVNGDISGVEAGAGVGPVDKAVNSVRRRTSSAFTAPTVRFEMSHLTSPRTPSHTPKSIQKHIISAPEKALPLSLPPTHQRSLSAPAAGRAVGKAQSRERQQPVPMRGTRSLADFTLSPESRHTPAPVPVPATTVFSTPTPTLVPTSTSTSLSPCPEPLRVAIAPTTLPSRMGILDILNRINGNNTANRSGTLVEIQSKVADNCIDSNTAETATPRMMAGGALFTRSGVTAPVVPYGCVSAAGTDTVKVHGPVSVSASPVEVSAITLPSPRRAAQGSRVLVGGGGKKHIEGPTR